MRYQDTTFFNMLKKYGLKRLVISNDFILALILSLSLIAFGCYTQLITLMLDKVSSIYPIIATGMIALIVASLAIITAIPDDKFILLLKEEGIYDNILFTFWIVSVVATFSLLVDVVILFLSAMSISMTTSVILLFVSTVLTTYSLFAVIQTIGDILRYGLYRADFLEKLLQEKTKQSNKSRYSRRRHYGTKSSKVTH